MSAKCHRCNHGSPFAVAHKLKHGVHLSSKVLHIFKHSTVIFSIVVSTLLDLLIKLSVLHVTEGEGRVVAVEDETVFSQQS